MRQKIYSIVSSQLTITQTEQPISVHSHLPEKNLYQHLVALVISQPKGTLAEVLVTELIKRRQFHKKDAN